MGGRDAGSDGETISTEDVESHATEFARALRDQSSARTPAEFVKLDRADWRVPGLYSWWVDAAGAAELSAALGSPVQPGLIYAGLAGATRWPGGRRSKNTLWSRIAGMHLGQKQGFSTFRLTLGAILGASRRSSGVTEADITTWMHDHLKVVTVVYEDGDTLGRLERSVLEVLDPPLNLQGMASSELRTTLKSLRKSHRAALPGTRPTSEAGRPDSGQRGGGYRDMVRTLGDAGLVVPFVTGPRERIRRLSPWSWASRTVDPISLYDFDLNAVADRVADGSPLFALSHFGHGVNSYALTLVTAAGPLAVVVQQAFGGIYTENDRSTDAINTMFERLAAVLGGFGRADRSPSVLCAWSELRRKGVCRVLRPSSALDVTGSESRDIHSADEFFHSLEEHGASAPR